MSERPSIETRAAMLDLLDAHEKGQLDLSPETVRALTSLLAAASQKGEGSSSFPSQKGDRRRDRRALSSPAVTAAEDETRDGRHPFYVEVERILTAHDLREMGVTDAVESLWSLLSGWRPWVPDTKPVPPEEGWPAAHAYVDGWNDCRDAMLAAAPAAPAVAAVPADPNEED